MSILAQIRAEREQDVAEAMCRRPLRLLEDELAQAPPPRDFAAALTAPGGIKIIAEIKRASPSAGVIRADLSPAEIAREYTRGGATALSVLTEPRHFRGSLADLSGVRTATHLPLLRKDFLFCRYQMLEARAAGADAVLLIVAMLSRAELRDLLAVAAELGLAALVEVHTAREVKTALEAGARIIGINNRNLRTMRVDTQTALRLRRRLGPGIIAVAESGIRNRTDVRRLQEAGFHAVLVGEALMRSADPGAAVAALLND